MKNLFQNLCLALLFVPFFTLTSCQPENEYVLQVAASEEVDCSGLDPETLDLSEGFQGTVIKQLNNPREFSIQSHQPQYDFPPSAGANENCRGYCSIAVQFGPADNSDEQTAANTSLSNVYLINSQNSAEVVLSSGDFDWNYPLLEIYVTAYAPYITYETDFLNNSGLNLEVEQVTVSGGLCVVENIAGQDEHGILRVPKGSGTGN